MKTLITITSFLICIPNTLFGGVLDSEVPWSGKVKNIDLASMITRMQGWSEGQGVGSMHVLGSLPSNLATKNIRDMVIADKPRPTYRDVLLAVYKSADQDVELVETKKGIEVTYIFTRIIRLNHGAKARLKRARQLSGEGILTKMKTEGINLTSFGRVTMMPNNDSFLVRGTVQDLNNTARFFGQK